MDIAYRFWSTSLEIGRARSPQSGTAEKGPLTLLRRPPTPDHAGEVGGRMMSGTAERASFSGGFGEGHEWRQICPGSSSVPMYTPGTAWMDDVALEMWIDAEQEPVRIRLAGTLDQKTAVNLVSALNRLIADGYRVFQFETYLQGCDPDRPRLIADLVRAVERRGGRLTWEESTRKVD